MNRGEPENCKGIRLDEQSRNRLVRIELRAVTQSLCREFPHVMGHARRIYRDSRKRAPTMRLDVTPGLWEWSCTPEAKRFAGKAVGIGTIYFVEPDRVWHVTMTEADYQAFCQHEIETQPSKDVPVDQMSAWLESRLKQRETNFL